MGSNEIKWLAMDNINFSANPIPEGMPYRELMKRGKVFPITKGQAREFIRQSCVLASLNNEDVRVMELFLNKHSMRGNYAYTSDGMVRLVNCCDFDKALRQEYNI